MVFPRLGEPVLTVRGQLATVCRVMVGPARPPEKLGRCVPSSADLVPKLGEAVPRLGMHPPTLREVVLRLRKPLPSVSLTEVAPAALPA